MINIEIAYAREDQQLIIPLRVNENTTVEQAILVSKINLLFPEINLQQNKCGIFSRIVALTELLKEGDRIEIYRPLTIDPKQARRLRVKKTKK